MIQISNFAAYRLPLIIETLQCNLPAAVEFTFKEPEEAEEEFRYIPDTELIHLKQELENFSRK